MNSEWLECLMAMEEEDYQTFKEKTLLQIEKELPSFFQKKDMSWLNVVERYLPFVKNTMESPYTLLVEEIQKNYESRFLYTLFLRLQSFLKEKYDAFQKEQEDAKTELEEEIILLHLSLTITQKQENKRRKEMEERIYQSIQFLEPLQTSPFMKLMEGCSLVRFPARKNTLMSANENYQKLFELSQFLDNYEKLENRSHTTKKEIELSRFLFPYYMNYALLSKETSPFKSDAKFLEKYLETFIKQFILESSLDDKTFKKMIQKIFEEEYEKKKNREKNISQIFKKSFDTHQKQVKDAIRALKG